MALRIYILVADDIPLGIAINSVAHASMAVALECKNDEVFKQYCDTSFKKITCKVTRQQMLDAASEFTGNDYVIVTESSIGHEITCVIFKPREEYPKQFKYFPLYK